MVDTSTSHPDTTRRLAAALAAQGMAMIDAPVSGGPKGAMTATMTMVIGGADDDVAAVEPILADMSAKRVHVGSVGAGHVCKIINNLLLGGTSAHRQRSDAIARDAEVDPARLLEGLNAGSGRYGVTLVNLPTWVLNGAFDSGFTMALMRKDVRLATQLIAKLALDRRSRGKPRGSGRRAPARSATAKTSTGSSSSSSAGCERTMTPFIDTRLRDALTPFWPDCAAIGSHVGGPYRSG